MTAKRVPHYNFKSSVYNNADESFDDTNHNRCIAIGLFKRKVTDNELRDMYSRYGSIRAVEVLPKHNTSLQLFFARIAFSNPDDAQNAIEKTNNKKFEGIKIKVKFASDQSLSITRPAFSNVRANDFSAQKQQIRIKNTEDKKEKLHHHHHKKSLESDESDDLIRKPNRRSRSVSAAVSNSESYASSSPPAKKVHKKKNKKIKSIHVASSSAASSLEIDSLQ